MNSLVFSQATEDIFRLEKKGWNDITLKSVLFQERASKALFLRSLNSIERELFIFTQYIIYISNNIPTNFELDLMYSL